MTSGDTDRDRKLLGGVGVACSRVDDHVECPVHGVAARLDGASNVLDADHRPAHDRAEVVLDRAGAKAAAVRVDQAELERVVRVHFELDLDDLVAQRRERADEREPRDVVVGGELVHRDGGRRVRLVLRDLEGHVPGDSTSVARRTLGDEELTPLPREMAVPHRGGAREPGARLRGRAGVRGGDGLPVRATRAPYAAPRQGAPRRRDRRRIESEPAP